ncbi:MAG: hypothetical protein M3Z24_00385 [Chloroflexota bacterium]|nr:hypothetical protein [Chloroflexota bacterium]
MRTQITVGQEDDRPIEMLDLSVRAYNCLKRKNIMYVSQIFTLNKETMLSCNYSGLQATGKG